ncbi:hypothetical protein Q1695_010113 [Nippostrongylus brasiliensis]|nr:hypothetical protein Q1695_010113 [Nippostrongylus brasiliensis]
MLFLIVGSMLASTMFDKRKSGKAHSQFNLLQRRLLSMDRSSSGSSTPREHAKGSRERVTKKGKKRAGGKRKHNKKGKSKDGKRKKRQNKKKGGSNEDTKSKEDVKMSTETVSAEPSVSVSRELITKSAADDTQDDAPPKAEEGSDDQKDNGRQSAEDAGAQRVLEKTQISEKEQPIVPSREKIKSGERVRGSAETAKKIGRSKDRTMSVEEPLRRSAKKAKKIGRSRDKTKSVEEPVRAKKIGRSRDKTISVEEPVRGSAETGKPGKKKGPDSLSEESEHAENSEPVSEDIEVLFPEELKEYVEKVTIGKLSRYGLGRGLGMSKIALYFVALSYMGTLTNITMFNYSMHRQGFVFIIPYLCCVYCISFPMVYLELALGQYTHASVLTIFDLIAPISVGGS